jgi:DNA ligase-4
VAGNTTLRVRNIAKSGRYSVAHVDWLLRSLAAGKLLPWTPADLLYATSTISKQLSAKYDKFGDSYTQPLTEDSLKYVFEQVEKMVTDVLISVSYGLVHIA